MPCQASLTILGQNLWSVQLQHYSSKLRGTGLIVYQLPYLYKMRSWSAVVLHIQHCHMSPLWWGITSACYVCYVHSTKWSMFNYTTIIPWWGWGNLVFLLCTWPWYYALVDEVTVTVLQLRSIPNNKEKIEPFTTHPEDVWAAPGGNLVGV